IKIISLVIFLFVVIIFVRNGYLQIWRGQDYSLLAEENRLRLKPIIAERGIIYDRNFSPLVTNIPSFNLVLTPQDLPQNTTERAKTLESISSLSGLGVSVIEDRLKNSKGHYFQSINLVENLNYEKAMGLIVSGATIPGLTIEQIYTRLYLYAPGATDSNSTSSINQVVPVDSLAHILGYTGKISKEELQSHPSYLLADYIGKTGLEKQYESLLRGTYGQKATEIDAMGKEKNIVKVSPPEVGKNLILTLNLNFQRTLEEITVNYLKKFNKKKAVAILLDPNNGEILAFVNLPSFNNNLFVNGISEENYQKLVTDKNSPLFSRGWSGLYPSGSTIKPLYASAALNEKVIDKNTVILSNGGIQVDRWFFPDWKAGGHGLTDVRKAIAESVNTFFYFIGGGYNNFVGLGLDKMILYLKKFNFGSSLGIDVPGEASGFIPSRQWKLNTKREQWFIGDTYNLSIGQGDLLVTPLQIASLTATIANGGTIYQPHFVKAFVDPSNNSTKEVAPIKLQDKVIPDAYLKIVREGMRQTITVGSGRLLADLAIPVAGKTGTAQWSNNAAENHAWFTSFAPYDNPKVVLTVLVEEGGEGSAVAAPIAKNFFSWYEKEVK
ncbi:MAG: penicillin-binding protein 2, partial [Candidatus Magasanikbacteria bacterium]|nr:penicillin-binding protein 2 [Candidatus Magasanikbacteria bacterium]